MEQKGRWETPTYEMDDQSKKDSIKKSIWRVKATEGQRAIGSKSNKQLSKAADKAETTETDKSRVID